MALSFKNFFTGFCSITNLIKLIPQVLGILILCGYWLMLIHKGSSVISGFYQITLDDLWRPMGLGIYLICFLVTWKKITKQSKNSHYMTNGGHLDRHSLNSYKSF